MSLKTTSTLPPEEIMNRVLSFLKGKKGVLLQQSQPFTVSVTVPPGSSFLETDTVTEDSGLTVEIEVCHAFRLTVHGLRFHRIMGDSFVYKSFCKHIIDSLDLS